MFGERSISGSLFAAIVLLFFMPFFSVSCGSSTVVEITGMQAATGHPPPEFRNPIDGSIERMDPQPGDPTAQAALGVAVAGVVLSVVGGTLLCVLRAALGGVGAGLLLYIKADFDRQILERGEGLVKLDYEVAFWASTFLFATAAAVNLYSFAMRFSTRGSIDPPEEADSPAPAPSGRLRVLFVFLLTIVSAGVIGAFFLSQMHSLMSTEEAFPAGSLIADCQDCPIMAVVPAGSFRMGDLSGQGALNERPVRTVTIPHSFAVSIYEVTWAEWEACVADNGCQPVNPRYGKADGGFGKGSRPVINVSWHDAKQYISWLSGKTRKRYRLLTESEWEYVARAGSTAIYSFGSSAEALCQYGNGADQPSLFDWANRSCSDGYDITTAPVGSFQPNAFGLHDVHGNVREWTEDCYESSYNGAPTDGSARKSGICEDRSVRGGGWPDGPLNLRSAVRVWIPPDIRSDSLGFRIARDLNRPMPN